METTNNQTDTTSSSKQTHKCSLCDYSTTRKYNLTRHMKNSHNESVSKKQSEQSSPPSPEVFLQPSEDGKKWFMPFLSCVGKYDHNDVIVAVYEDLKKRQHTFTEDVDPENNILEQIMSSLSKILKEKIDTNQESQIPSFYLAYDIFLVLGALLHCKPCLIRKSRDAYKECIVLASIALRVLGYNIVTSNNNGGNKDSDQGHCDHAGCSGCHHG